MIISGSQPWITSVLAWSSNISKIFMVNSKISPCLWNWIAKLNCEWRIIVKSWKAFHLASQWFCLCEVSETKVMLSFNLLAIFTVKCNDSVSFSFLFPCFLCSSLWTKICVFELSVPCVRIFHCVIAAEFEFQLVQSTGCSW